MINTNTRIVFFGTPDFVVPVLQTLIKNFNVVGVVTAPDKKVGRKQILTPSPVKLASQGPTLQGYSFKVFIPEKLNDDFGNKLQTLNPDLFVVAAYGKIIPQNILDIPKKGAINIHPSLLPKYRGPSPIQSAVLAGDEVTGISIIKMDEKMDHGPLIYSEEFTISELDNFQTLSTKMFLQSSLFLPKIIPAYLAGKIKLQEQNENNASYCKIIKKEDGFFDIDNPPSQEKLDKMARAYYPWPNVWTKWQNKIIKFYPNRMIQMEGKKVVRLEEFLRGYPNFPLQKLN